MLFIEALANTLVVLAILVVFYRVMVASLGVLVDRTHARIAREESKNLDAELRRLIDRA